MSTSKVLINNLRLIIVLHGIITSKGKCKRNYLQSYLHQILAHRAKCCFDKKLEKNSFLNRRHRKYLK